MSATSDEVKRLFLKILGRSKPGEADKLIKGLRSGDFDRPRIYMGFSVSPITHMSNASWGKDLRRAMQSWVWYAEGVLTNDDYAATVKLAEEWLTAAIVAETAKGETSE